MSAIATIEPFPGDTRTWAWSWRWKRIQLRLRVLRHRYPHPTTPDRWVAQPCIVYDKKAR